MEQIQNGRVLQRTRPEVPGAAHDGASSRAQGLRALQQDRIDAAIELLFQAVKGDSCDAEAHAGLGNAFSRKGLHTAARHALETAVELQARNVRFRLDLGAALERALDPVGADAVYQELLRIAPSCAMAEERLQMIWRPFPPAGRELREALLSHSHPRGSPLRIE